VEVELSLVRTCGFISATRGVCSASRAPIGDVLAFSPTRELYSESMREIAAVAKAKGIKLADDIVAQFLARADGMNGTMKPSMPRDLEAGKRLEADALNGAV
jgi:2-dehydropantoate 2-reductase